MLINLKRKIVYHTGLFLLIIFIQTNFADIKLPKLISDGIVLQRNAKVKIWGWASPGEKVSIKFCGKTFSNVTGSDGKWMVSINKLKTGGPYEMEISGKNVIVVKNILVGDVWVCSGQSNMQTPISRLKDLYGSEIATSKNDMIRYYEVPMKYYFTNPLDDLSGGKWISPNPENVLSFAAVPYFFARNLYEKYHVPIGVINSSVGGTPIEAWMSEDALKEFPSHWETLKKYQDSNLVNQIKLSDRKRIEDWYSQSVKKDLGYSKDGTSWHDLDVNTEDWASINIPSYWDEAGLIKKNGIVWFRKEFEIPESMAGKAVRLNLGRIVDSDSAFVNGKFVGTIAYQYPPRVYQIPEGVLKSGKNVLVVRVLNSWGRGGFIKDKPYNIILGEETIDLKGEWKYKLGTEMPPLAGETFIQYFPGGLFNGMIAPLTSFSIKGIVWYQGESNTGRAKEYQKLFPTLINDWRTKWNLGILPFIYAQLPNFMQVKKEPSESQWAELREAQFKTLSIPRTGMSVNLDIGEWNDIHPLRKKIVAERLAMLAQNIAYRNSKLVASGPLFEKMKIDENKIILTFKCIGSGLATKDGKELTNFAIAGADKKFVWAKAEIKNNKVIVWNDLITEPVAVRYAWADNPEGANLCNMEGLLASPFRTDE